MRLILSALAAGTLLAAASASPSLAQQPTWYPWCAHYSGMDYGGAIACGYVTREQCMASVSGVGGFCEQNAWPPPQTRPQSRATRKSPAH